ncbi:odorant receptor 188 [Nasonia vitripennis]|uniref:Odorant receptor n=1 Tax=Nasonia vitripennis TaxID=7425 RepID=A0A7M6UWP5_NASVI|nr:odorant receptor 188 [Nasonia vitripennis]
MNIFDFPQRHLLTCLGLWPYQSKFTQRIFFTCAILSFFSLFVAMAAGLGEEWSTELVIIYETIVALFVIFGGLAKCIVLFCRKHQMKSLYDQIRKDWQELTNEKEAAILQSFMLKGKAQIILYVVCAIPGYFIFVALTYVPIISSEDASKDYSHTFPYYTDLLILSKRFRVYQVFIHAGLGIFCGGITYVAFMAMYITCVRHVCALYAIVRYRLENMVKSQDKLMDKLNDDEEVIPGLLEIICTHKRAIKRVRLINRIFSRTFFMVEICLLICLALLIFDVKYNQHNVRLVIRMLMIALMFIVHVFCMNYCGEQVIQFSTDVQYAAYFMEWYMISSRAQKILIMILCRSSNPDYLTAGNMALSLKNFASIVRTSWSMATVLLTTQKVNRPSYSIS